MSDGLHVDPMVIAHRCAVNSPDYSSLTPLDWVVLDFTDGRRTFERFTEIIPFSREDLAVALIHLRLLGFVTWKAPEKTSRPENNNGISSPVNSTQIGAGVLSTLSDLDGASRQPSPESSPASFQSRKAISLSAVKPAVSLAPASHHYSDELCSQFIPQRMFDDFKKFTPTLTDSKFDIPLETQVFIEFIHENLTTMTPYDLLGLPEGTTDKAAIRNAYMQRTKQFHPDRFFRKNTGAFAPRIAAIFKAISAAFKKLS